nr:hypothetical protein CFP56_50795 [Quercus suber]
MRQRMVEKELRFKVSVQDHWKRHQHRQFDCLRDTLRNRVYAMGQPTIVIDSWIRYGMAVLLRSLDQRPPFKISCYITCFWVLSIHTNSKSHSHPRSPNRSKAVSFEKLEMARVSEVKSMRILYGMLQPFRTSRQGEAEAHQGVRPDRVVSSRCSGSVRGKSYSPSDQSDYPGSLNANKLLAT